MTEGLRQFAEEFEELKRLVDEIRLRAIHIGDRVVSIDTRGVNINDKVNYILQREVPLNSDIIPEGTYQRWGGRTYAQHGDDLIAMAILEEMGVGHPSYIDVGAHAPYDLSNTALMYQRGCRGVNIEPNPSLFHGFEVQRPDDVNLNIGVSDQSGILKFYMFDERSGLNTFDPERVKYVESHSESRVTKVIDIAVSTITEVIDTHCGGVFPDFMSLDVEGLDLTILSSIDYARHKPKLICVEANTQDDINNMKALLLNKGYRLVFKSVMNLFFADAELYKI